MQPGNQDPNQMNGNTYDPYGQYEGQPNGNVQPQDASYVSYPSAPLFFAEQSYQPQNQQIMQNSGGMPMQNSGGIPMQNSGGMPIQNSGGMPAFGMMGQMPGYPQQPMMNMQPSVSEQPPIAYDAPVMPDQNQRQIPTPQTTGEFRTPPKPKLTERLREQIRTNRKPWIFGGVAVLMVIAAVIILASALNRHGYNAEDVVRSLYRRQMPISSPVIYTKETDPDGLLGSWHSYTSKVAWTDTGIQGGKNILENGGIVEVFASADDAAVRRKQLGNMLVSQSGYVSQVNRVVMRLSPLMDEEKTASYQEALRLMFGKTE